MRNIAVIGAGFGDEGKGKVVSYFCKELDNPLVIRFSGGQQAAHHVMIDEKTEHVFSNFGSGTLQGCDTYWSKYCTVDPVGILNELDVLGEKTTFLPMLYIDGQCPVTTPYDKYYNKIIEGVNGHGTCGVGIGTTHQREANHYSLLAEDLLFPSVLKIKLDMIRKYYESLGVLFPADDIIGSFMKDCHKALILPLVEISDDNIVLNYSNIIFEGSQGLLLDQNIGFFPHVTRGNTGVKNILEISYTPEVFLVTRAYQTRHGNGPMTAENIPHKIKRNPYERNLDNGCQGVFRTSILDLDLLGYIVKKENALIARKINLVVTCLDLVTEEYSFVLNEQVVNCKSESEFITRIKKELGIIDKVYLGRTPFPELEQF